MVEVAAMLTKNCHATRVQLSHQLTSSSLPVRVLAVMKINPMNFAYEVLCAVHRIHWA